MRCHVTQHHSAHLAIRHLCSIGKQLEPCLPVQDAVIQRFEDRCTEANVEIQQLQAALQDSSKRLETADNRLSSTMDSRNKLRKQLEAKHAEMTSLQASLQADKEVLQVLLVSPSPQVRNSILHDGQCSASK